MHDKTAEISSGQYLDGKTQLMRSDISRVDIAVARAYLFYTCVLTMICSVWTLDNYIHGDLSMRAYAWITTIASAMMIMGLTTEWAIYRGMCNRKVKHAEKLRQHGIGVTLVHIATASIGVFSTCAAAVNIYGNAAAGLYGLSCFVIATNWLYYVLFTPSTVMHLAVFAYVSEAEQYVLAEQQRSIRYIWRQSAATPACA